MLMQNLGAQTNSIMVFLKVAYLKTSSAVIVLCMRLMLGMKHETLQVIKLQMGVGIRLNP